MTKRIGVLGAGAIGSSVGADLTEAGEDVVLIDQWPAHVEAMRTEGLRIVMPNTEVNEKVRALHIGELATERPTFDVVLLAAKSYDTVWMCHLIKPYLADQGVFVGLQNGMNEEMITPIVGSERTVACVVELSAEIWEPGLVQRDTTREGTWFAVGEIDGAISNRVEEVAALLRYSARVDVTDNIFGAKWSKLVVNSMTMGPYSLLGLKNWKASALPGMTEISVRLGRESVAVGEGLGYRLAPIFGMSAEQFSGYGRRDAGQCDPGTARPHREGRDHGHRPGSTEGSSHRDRPHHGDGGPQRAGGWGAYPRQRRGVAAGR